ncbi:protein amnionless-like [Babylonia areolata]|uniref:protein amnionless-like n=1 Tax=Babylonia areolata TaxID=304850 RepID=UPI003FD0C778
MNFVIYTGLLLVFCCGGGDAIYKRWLKNTNFENPLNWNVQPPRAPCGNDRVLIPDDSPVVYMQMNTSLQELTLPKNGEIVLGNNVQLAFTQDASDDCPSAGGDVEFTAVNPSSWSNPDNWCTSSAELSDCQPSSPVDTENVPCVNDDVVFLRHRSYYVTLGRGIPLTMKTLKITGTSFTTTSFAQYVNSTAGRKVFKPPSSGPVRSSVTITRQGCNDMRGCACGNDGGQMQTAICAIKSKRCERSPCQSPVTPVGACCDMCGAVFNCTRGRGFNFNSFKTKLQNNFFNLYPNVTTAVSVTGAGFVQVVLKDSNDGSDTARLAALIKADMDKDLQNGGHKYALDAYSLTAATGGTSAHKGGGGSTTLSGGSIAGIIIGLILLFVVIAVVALIYRRGRPDLSRFPNWPDWSQFTRNFTRFSARREPPSGSATPPRTLGPLDPGFNNPLYDSAPFDDANAREMELRSPMEEQPTFDMSGKDGGGFNNPLYAATPGFFSDPSEVSTTVAETAEPKPPGSSNV